MSAVFSAATEKPTRLLTAAASPPSPETSHYDFDLFTIGASGGGVLASRFASNGLASEVHVFIRQKKVSRGFDEEVRTYQKLLELQSVYYLSTDLTNTAELFIFGICWRTDVVEFHTEESPVAIGKSSDGSLSLNTNKGTVEGFSHIMLATGRRPNTRSLRNDCRALHCHTNLKKAIKFS